MANDDQRVTALWEPAPYCRVVGVALAGLSALAISVLPDTIDVLTASLRALTDADGAAVTSIRIALMVWACLVVAESAAVQAMHLLACWTGERAWMIALLSPRSYLRLDRWFFDPMSWSYVVAVIMLLQSPSCLAGSAAPCLQSSMALFVLGMSSSRLLQQSSRLAKESIDHASRG